METYVFALKMVLDADRAFEPQFTHSLDKSEDYNVFALKMTLYWQGL